MTKTLAFVLSACLAACAGQAEVRYSGTVADPEPDLVAMETDPSVMVVANADEPVFYVDNTYWLYRDHYWYRSSSHRGGWARIDQPPEHVRRIQRPEVYVHYRHTASAPRTTVNEHRDEHRDERRDERRDAVPTPPPDRRDMHERDMRDVKVPRDPREERRDQAPPGPAREPNSQGPVQPYANPLPPQQVPPASDDHHVGRDHPDHPVAPDHARSVRPDDRDRDDRKDHDERDRDRNGRDRNNDRRDEHDTRKGPRASEQQPHTAPGAPDERESR